MTELTAPPAIDLDAWLIGDRNMTRSEHAILSALLERPGHVVSNFDLYVAIWGYAPADCFGRMTSRAIPSHVSHLRAKGVRIENVWGQGYRLRANAVANGDSEPRMLDEEHRRAGWS